MFLELFGSTVLAITAFRVQPEVVTNSTPSYCADAETVRQAFANGFEPDTESRQYPGDGLRVQRQHPNTALYGVAKYISDGAQPVVLCQYANQVGVVYMRVFIPPNIDPDQACADGGCGEGDYWRREWVESSPESDRPGQEMMWACVREDAAGIASPSLGCRFYLPPEGAPTPDVHGADGATTTPPDRAARRF